MWGSFRVCVLGKMFVIGVGTETGKLGLVWNLLILGFAELE